mmetsp:Transcript_11682/g.16574  ORF Transcript_11682/g.16574 Transcript_11682/m.16574 type:complete len:99 (-) Transcript_11682:1319-1615(-)
MHKSMAMKCSLYSLLMAMIVATLEATPSKPIDSRPSSLSKKVFPSTFGTTKTTTTTTTNTHISNEDSSSTRQADDDDDDDDWLPRGRMVLCYYFPCWI